MSRRSRAIIIIISFTVVFVLLVSGYNLKKAKIGEFEALQAKVTGFASTTLERIAKGVVTLPDGNMVVGLNNNIGLYKSETGASGVVEVKSEYLKTKLIEGIYNKQTPRLDAIVPMHINVDSEGGSIYIVLFNDRGDAVIEKSYARIGGLGVIISEITTLPRDASIKGEEYRVYVTYKSRSDSTIIKEVIIPVVDGHFDPIGTISKQNGIITK